MVECNYSFSSEKNALLKESRGVSFEEVVNVIQEGGVLDIIEHPNKVKYGNQKVYVVEIDGYVYLVPFVKIEEENSFFLKTIYPSRKFTKKYFKKEI